MCAKTGGSARVCENKRPNSFSSSSSGLGVFVNVGVFVKFSVSTSSSSSKFWEKMLDLNFTKNGRYYILEQNIAINS